MKAIFLAVFLVAVTATPLPEDNGSNAVEMVVNRLPDGAALEVGDTVDIKLKKHSKGTVVVTNLLHPYTAFGIAEAAAAAEAEIALTKPEASAVAESNDVSVVDNNEAHDLQPMPIVVPSPPSSVHIVDEQPANPLAPEVVISEPVVMPPPAIPELVELEPLPVAAPQYSGGAYNDGHVQVQYNGPQDPGMLSTLQNWFNVVINYFTPSNSSTVAPVLRY